MKAHRHEIAAILAGGLAVISVLVTLVSAFFYFVTSQSQKFYSYLFYQQIALFIYQSQEDAGLAIFRIPGIFLLGGFAAFLILLLLIALLVVLLDVLFSKIKEKSDRKFKKASKKYKVQKFKTPSPLMFVKWGVVLLYLAAIFYFAGYYFNDILNPIDIWMHYVLLYMYSILGGFFINFMFNFGKPLRTNRYLELTALVLLGGAFALAYFYLDFLGVSLVYYIHSCILLGLIAVTNAFDFCSITAHRCPECHGRCEETLISSKTTTWDGVGFEDRMRKVGTRETTYTISTDRGDVIGEAKGSEDIYEHYTGTYDTEESSTENLYDCVCVHCGHSEKTQGIIRSSRRV